jgi:hypothetical protein
MPIVDFLNAAYNDNISYDAKLYYADKEINNFDKKSSRYISFYADMYIKVIDREKIYEYEIEFQTVYENSMAIRMFRYGFERSVKLADYNNIKEGKIKIKLPEPYLIVLEEDKDIPDEISDEMTSAIENINSYFLSMYGRYTDFDEEVKEMVKSFYDPKVEERGREKGKIETAEEMIREGEPIEKIKKYTKLDENKILELIKQIGTKKVQ